MENSQNDLEIKRLEGNQMSESDEFITFNNFILYIKE